MLKKMRLIFGVSLFSCALAMQSQSLNPANFDRLANSGETIENLSSFGFSDDELPSRFSLSDYALVSSQNGGSCVGFSVCGALNIMHNYLNDIEDYDSKYVHRFDPYYLYCALKDPEDIKCIGEDCNCGADIYDGLDIVKTYGVKKSALTPRLDCGNQISKGNLRTLSSFTEAYTVDNVHSLCEYKKKDGAWEVLFNIDDFKWAISNYYPIVTGIGVGDGFDEITGELASYSAPPGAMEGHAVTIVGYDDTVEGGSFQILNSYGSEWGDNGFFWMTYQDYMKSASQAYILAKDDWGTWLHSEPFTSGSFYRGKSEGDDKFWEGPLNVDGYFDGQGVEITGKHVAIGNYTDGLRSGWWFILQKPNLDDPWRGYVLFDNGEIIDSESLGFSSDDGGKQEFSAMLELQQYGMTIEDGSATSDDIFMDTEKASPPK